ncbi:TldD/PmbA family protein [Acholeplasma laidlawii]|uniref:TldD/PmbA family protein n=1 Tax=Acholeplasma laidlawii TaxID=2148 RepID=UPI0018C279E2|nr:TldD/PmbA family protein [Acholeplasma laidlawii]MBG0763150.1 TldD/PmbA family protein [Acholeplasma laidlawii]
MFKNWIEIGLNKGFSDVEIFSTRSKSLSIEVYQGKVENLTTADVEKAKIRAVYDEKLVSFVLEDLSDEAVHKAFDLLKLNAEALTVKEPAIIFEGSPSYPVVKENTFDFDSVPVKDKIDYLIALEKNVLANEFVKQVDTTSYSESYGETTIINSKGLNLTRKHNFSYAYAVGIFEKNGDIKSGYDITLAKKFSDFDAQKDAQKTIDNGLSKLDGKSIKTKKYDTVFSAKRFGDMLGVFSGLFSGEAAYRKMTPLKDKKGQQIAVEGFNLWDDPLNELAPFQNSFDDEGVASNPKKIIDNGVFTGFLHSLKTAKLFNETPTGNAFGGGIGPAGLYLEPGKKDFNALIKDIKEGFYVTDLVGLHAGVNHSNGSFSLQAGGVFIKDGKLDHPVKMVVLSGNWFDVLKNIQGIGSDLTFDVSGTGSPTVHVGELMVSGEEK